MRILGIDPGFDRTGWGVIDSSGASAKWVAHGCIQTMKEQEFVERIQCVRNDLRQIIQQYRPEGVVIEHLFFSNNAKTAIKVGMARGVAMLTVADEGVPIIELTPNQVKQGIAGWGGADKKAVQQMVQTILKLPAPPTPDDAADALAMAIVGALLFRIPKSAK